MLGRGRRGKGEGGRGRERGKRQGWGIELCIPMLESILSLSYQFLLPFHAINIGFHFKAREVLWSPDEVGEGAFPQTDVAEIGPCCSHGPSAMDLPHGILSSFWNSGCNSFFQYHLLLPRDHHKKTGFLGFKLKSYLCCSSYLVLAKEACLRKPV